MNKVLMGFAVTALMACGGSPDTQPDESATASDQAELSCRKSNWNIPWHDLHGWHCTHSGAGSRCTAWYAVEPDNARFTQDYFCSCPARGTHIGIATYWFGNDTLTGFTLSH